MSHIAAKLTTVAENQQKVFDAGYDKGVTHGKQAEYDAFWNAFQHNGKRSNYNYGFYDWPDGAFHPKYKFTKDKSITATSMFQSAQIVDLSEHSFNAMTFSNAFGGCAYLTQIGGIYTGNATCSFNNLFNLCMELHTVQLLSCKSNNSFTNAFSGCRKLKEIRFEGEIGRSISFKNSSLLSADSVASIFDHLVAPTATNQSLTFNAATVLTEEQKSKATGLGWQIVQ